MYSVLLPFLRLTCLSVGVFSLVACGGGGGGPAAGDGSASPPTPQPLVSCPETLSGNQGVEVQVSCTSGDGVVLDSKAWEFVSKPPGSSLVSLGSELATHFTPDEVGDYELRLTVTASTQTETHSIRVTVANNAPEVSCNSPTSVRAGEEVTVSCTATDPGNITPTLTYTWTTVSGPVGFTPAPLDQATIKFTPMGAGDFVLKLTVSDGDLTTEKTVSVNATAHLVKIVPVGDSITQGNINSNTYRYELWKLLIDQGYLPGVDFDFIGSQTSNDGGDPAGLQQDYQGYAFDKDNEGHWGKRADEVLGFLNSATYAPDIALVHLGTNDVKDGDTNTQIVQDLQNVMNQLKALNTNVHIYLALLIPAESSSFPNLTEANITALNTAIQNSTLATTPNVTVVDQNTGYVAIDDNYDGIHPNGSGESKMAQKWFDAIQADLQAMAGK